MATPPPDLARLLGALRSAKDPWSRLRLVAGGARSLARLTQRERRELFRKIGLEGAEELADLAAAGDPAAGQAVEQALRSLEANPQNLQRFLRAVADPQTRRATLSGLAAHVMEAATAPPAAEAEVGAPAAADGTAAGTAPAAEVAKAEAAAAALGGGTPPAPAAAGASRPPAAGRAGAAAGAAAGDLGGRATTPPAARPQATGASPSVPAAPPARPAAAPPLAPPAAGGAPAAPPVASPAAYRPATPDSPPTPPRAAEKPLASPVPPEPSQPRRPAGGAQAAELSTGLGEDAATVAPALAALQTLRRRLLDGPPPDTDAVEALLERELTSDWARRRALAALFARGMPASAGEALALVGRLETVADRRWALADLAASRRWSDIDFGRIVEAADTAATRRRLLARRIAG